MSARDQLFRLERLVGAHETYWAAVAQRNPQSVAVRNFLAQHWDPWLTSWTMTRHQMDPASTEQVEAIVHWGSQSLVYLRDLAEHDGIPTPGLGDLQMHNQRVGAEAMTYPEIAALAVQRTSQQRPSVMYGYLRTGNHQKIYLFGALEDARGWLFALAQGQAQPYDYAAVFAASDLTRPVAGLESFGHTAVSGSPHVGSVLPFLLGVPLGAVAGYFYRGWQDKHPGHWIPGIAGDPSVGGPWVDMVGGPWVDMVGRWGNLVGPQVGGPWVDMIGGPWMDMVGPQVGGPWVDMIGMQMVGPQIGADYPTAAALTQAAAHAAATAARQQQWQQTHALIESAKNDAIDAQSLAPAAAWVWTLDPPGTSSRPGVELTGTSAIVPFSSVDQAQAYMFERIQTPHVAIALFDTSATGHWPNPVRWSKNSVRGTDYLIAQYLAAPRTRAMQAPSQISGGAYVGADPIAAVRAYAKGLASSKPGHAVGVLRSADSLWHRMAFASLDDAVDWLQSATGDRSTFLYAAIYDKGPDGTAFIQDEEIGGGRAAPLPGQSIPRQIATTSGSRWAA